MATVSKAAVMRVLDAAIRAVDASPRELVARLDDAKKKAIELERALRKDRGNQVLRARLKAANLEVLKASEELSRAMATAPVKIIRKGDPGHF